MANMFVTEPIPSGRIRLKTTHGPIEIELWPKETPKACRNFVQLCLEGYYDGVIFHRIVPGFIVQTGDPSGTGSGGESIYDEGVFDDEINARLKFSRRGLVAMANLGTRNTNTSQFFFTLDRADELQDKHTIFGSVIGDTIYNVIRLSEAEVDRKERPVHPPVIKSVEVIDNPFPDIAPRITREQIKEQAKAKKEAKREKAKEKMKSKHRTLAKNKGLLSFADEEQLTGPAADEEGSRPKFRSAHDVEASSQLSSKIIDPRRSAIDIPTPSLVQGSDPALRQHDDESQPVKMHSALKAVAKRRTSDSQEKREIGPSTAPRKKQKNDAERVKDEIAKMEADLKKGMNSDGSGSEHEATKGGQKSSKSQKSQQGRSLLEAERARYKARAEKTISRVSAPTNKGGSAGIDLILDGFRSKLRGAEGHSKSVEAGEDRLDGYAGEVDPTQDGVLGDVDDDDDGWMAHELKFRKDATVDQHRADEYAVVDPLANRKFTLDELAARKTEKRHAEFNNPDGNKKSTTSKTRHGRDSAQSRRY
ncbi:cyclophilin-like domain-containing protein [Melampsora americana]|nr:cyclophilin-like domain-containing protein [Melampsora americana]